MYSFQSRNFTFRIAAEIYKKAEIDLDEEAIATIALFVIGKNPRCLNVYSWGICYINFSITL